MPIAMSMREWSRIKKWAEPDSEDQETVKRREYVNYLNETSRMMTRDWPNSLENVNKRNEELRRVRIAMAEEANTKFYKRYMKKKKEEQEQLMYSARDIVFKNRDAPKLLLSAVIETAVQKERIEQIKFANKLRSEANAEQLKYDNDIKRKAKEWHELNATRAKRRFEINKQNQKEILEQIHEIAERNRIEHETELNLQKIDNINALKEMQAIADFEKELQAKEKVRIRHDIEKAKEERQARLREQEARDKMDDKLINVLNKSRARIERKRKQTEKEAKDEKNRILDIIRLRLTSGDAARDAKEQAILEKANREREEAEEARFEKDRRKVEAIRKERQESREQFLKEEERKIQEFNAVQQWEIMNRFKNEELYKDYLEKLRQERRRKILDYRDDILKLWKEREDRDGGELAARRYFYGELARKKMRDEDNKVLTYAKHLLAEAKNNDRPTYALHRTVDTYCKLNRLLPMPDLPASMQEHFQGYKTWDGTEPDPDYLEPPPPRSLATKSKAQDSLLDIVDEENGSKIEDTKKEPVKEQTKEETKKEPAKEKHEPEDTKKETKKEELKKGDKDETKVEKRAGLQELPKAGTSGMSKLANAKVDKPSDDYKRAGPANGLQVRNLQTTCELPPITVEPCCCCAKSSK